MLVGYCILPATKMIYLDLDIKILLKLKLIADVFVQIRKISNS